ncbi:uncharacterized protein LOC143035250 isoform X2 [Oratosquilla oratoria]|uniref:uncharacterized protein LOC143035250 isoform X2 n=1 Tax=Oratosquilla oratoria TaxID=337810 RepID=UPI003F761DCA
MYRFQIKRPRATEEGVGDEENNGNKVRSVLRNYPVDTVVSIRGRKARPWSWGGDPRTETLTADNEGQGDLDQENEREPLVLKPTTRLLPFTRHITASQADTIHLESPRGDSSSNSRDNLLRTESKVTVHVDPFSRPSTSRSRTFTFSASQASSSTEIAIATRPLPTPRKRFTKSPCKPDYTRTWRMSSISAPGNLVYGTTSCHKNDPSSSHQVALLAPRVNLWRRIAHIIKEKIRKYRHTRISGKKIRKRVVYKNGECNVTQTNVAKRRRRYLQDIFTTLVDIQWRWTLLVFAMSFMLSWLVFALMWWIIVFAHGDLIEEHLPERQSDIGWTPCVMNIYSFTSCFLFSVETQHTIGYGSRHTTEECPEAVIVMCIQSITGVMIQAFMVGIVFTKLSRPKKRTQTLMFSRNACICLRDDKMCLLFRVGDMRKSHIIEAHVRAQLIRKRVTKEGEVLPFFQYELDVGYDIGEDRIFFIWPMTIVHKIDENSPLYSLSAQDLLRDKFEIVVILEGVIESTGMTTQARSSYLPNEILWGHRFEPLVSFKKDTGEYAVDYSLFNNTYQVNTPLCSARDLDLFNGSQRSTPAPITPLTPASPLTPLTPPFSPAVTGPLRSRAGVNSSSNSDGSVENDDEDNNNSKSTKNISSMSNKLALTATTPQGHQEGDSADTSASASQPLLDHDSNV